jgi:hypothetical protein
MWKLEIGSKIGRNIYLMFLGCLGRQKALQKILNECDREGSWDSLGATNVPCSAYSNQSTALDYMWYKYEDMKETQALKSDVIDKY